jgi:non-ribosomal peptide synthetase-like protein
MKHVNVEKALEAAGAIDGLLHRYFEEQVRRRPDHTAVECNGEALTYAQLNERANRIALRLRAAGAGTDTLVALFMVKSCDLFAAMLGIMKSGAGYVPIDSKFPVGRICAIVEDAAIGIVLTDRTLVGTIADELAAKILVIDGDWEDTAPGSAAMPIITPRDICYVIYTSGSTGRPKGVVIEHRNAVNFVQALRTVYEINEDDRVYQGFSVAFDASIEEIWAAFSVGGTLVVPPEDIARSTFDAAEFISAKRISFFSTVPSFLALLTPDLPTLKLLVLGGEVCSTQLVARWARPGLRILNTYGPTEATVVATAFDCLPNQPVSIGSALPGYVTHVLDEQLKPVKVGETGELYLGGKGVARGYLNKPQLTAEKFVIVPDLDPAGCLYRTNDLVRLLENGQLQFVGRSDSQVKVRGFRIELSEIENVLLEYSGIRQAAVTTIELDGMREIAAFVVFDGGLNALDRHALADVLRHRIPDYMMPKYLDVVDALPTMTSGKIDRKALPPPTDLLRQPATKIAVAETELQRGMVAVWHRIMHVSNVSIDDDFFVDLHGHSLLAARVVSELRSVMAGVDVSVRDIYQHRTIRNLSALLQTRRDSEAPSQPANAAGRQCPQSVEEFATLPKVRWLVVLLQSFALLAFYGVVALPFGCAVLLVLQVIDGTLQWEAAAEIATIGSFATWPSWLLLSIAVKWAVVGRYKEGRYPVWGFYYFRWWLATRFQALSWSEMFVDTPLMNIYYRLMGAKVGKNCTIGTPVCAAFDLVSIGDNASIGAETHILGYKIENGWLVIGPVSIGEGCYIGTHCALGINVRMADRSCLEDLSALADDAIVDSDITKRGSPANNTNGSATELPRSRGRVLSFLFGLIHLLLIYSMGYLLILSALPAVAIVALALYSGGPWIAFAASLATVPVSLLWYLKLVTTVKRLFVGRIKPGNYSTYSLTFLRYWFLNYLMNNTKHLVLPLYATLFFPRFLRSLGATIGRNVEISTISQAMPDLLDIGDGSFLADGCVVGGAKIHGGRIELKANRVGRRTFVGNSALVPAGINLGDDGLVGVLSTPPAGVTETQDTTRWLGSPGFLLPATEKVSCFSARTTYEPGMLLILARTLVDVIRIFLPGFVSIAALGLFCAFVSISYRTLSLIPTLLLTPVFGSVVCFLTLIAVAALRHLFMGQFKPAVKPLWSAYVWFNEVVNALYEATAAPLLAPMLGTPYAAWFLRLLGCQIGKWVFLETTLLSEFDLMKIGDRAALNLGSTVQSHLFEDRVMKSDTIEVGDFCSIGNMAVVLYGTSMGSGSVLGPLSVLMKGESLPNWSRWHGIPSQPMEWPATRQQGRQRPKLAKTSVRGRVSPQADRVLKNHLLSSTSAIGLHAGSRPGSASVTDGADITQRAA